MRWSSMTTLGVGRDDRRVGTETSAKWEGTPSVLANKGREESCPRVRITAPIIIPPNTMVLV